jgi:hypothetical protein
MTMTRDPDLDAAIEDMIPDAKRLRLLQRQVAQADEVKDYRNLAARKFELADLTERFNVRGERLKMAEDRVMAGRTLLMVVEEASRLWERYRRRPNELRLYEALTIAGEMQDKLRDEAAAELVLVEYARKVATHNAAAISSALRYLEASR